MPHNPDPLIESRVLAAIMRGMLREARKQELFRMRVERQERREYVASEARKALEAIETDLMPELLAEHRKGMARLNQDQIGLGIALSGKGLFPCATT